MTCTTTWQWATYSSLLSRSLSMANQSTCDARNPFYVETNAETERWTLVDQTTFSNPLNIGARGANFVNFFFFPCLVIVLQVDWAVSNPNRTKYDWPSELTWFRDGLAHSQSWNWSSNISTNTRSHSMHIYVHGWDSRWTTSISTNALTLNPGVANQARRGYFSFEPKRKTTWSCILS